jgi:hypothetical protein
VEPQALSPRNWTKEFQEILLRPVLERGTELQKLCDEFVATAKQFGEVIIRERNLPYHQKTIKPLRGKGLAGGEKYQVANIFFKFAVNKDGSLYPSDRFAMKVAGTFCRHPSGTLAFMFLFSILIALTRVHHRT